MIDWHPRAIGDLASIDWSAALTGLSAGRWPCSGSDEKILRLSASLAEEAPVDLGREMWGLDRDNTARVAAAVMQAAGYPGLGAGLLVGDR